MNREDVAVQPASVRAGDRLLEEVTSRSLGGRGGLAGSQPVCIASE